MLTTKYVDIMTQYVSCDEMTQTGLFNLLSSTRHWLSKTGFPTQLFLNVYFIFSSYFFISLKMMYKNYLCKYTTRQYIRPRL